MNIETIKKTIADKEYDIVYYKKKYDDAEDKIATAKEELEYWKARLEDWKD